MPHLGYSQYPPYGYTAPLGPPPAYPYMAPSSYIGPSSYSVQPSYTGTPGVINITSSITIRLTSHSYMI
jgi:hypothetical protein